MRFNPVVTAVIKHVSMIYCVQIAICVVYSACTRGCWISGNWKCARMAAEPTRRYNTLLCQRKMSYWPISDITQTYNNFLVIVLLHYAKRFAFFCRVKHQVSKELRTTNKIRKTHSTVTKCTVTLAHLLQQKNINNTIMKHTVFKHVTQCSGVPF